MRCIGCDRIHKNYQKSLSWTQFQLCPKCFRKDFVKLVLCKLGVQEIV